MPRCSSTGNWAPARCGWPRRPTGTPCGGGGVETWEPRFTIHGFRYVEIDGWPGKIDPDDLRAVVLHSDMRRTGWFSCSDELLNRLHENVLWSMRGNFVDLPTDCPQRDERLGWTGDIQVFAPTAAFLYDCTGMLASWLADVAAEQAELGTVPVYVPYIPSQFPIAPVAAWGDAAVVVPWVLYQRTGDAGLLRRQYPSMRAWVDEIDRAAGPTHLWDSGFQLGDWLDPAAPPDRPADARTDRALVATAYLAYSADLLAQAADVLGNSDDHRRYAGLAAATRAAFRHEYVSPSGRLVSDAPTAVALALRFELLLPEQRDTAGRRLVALVKAADHRVATGFVGTPIICDALCDVGAYDTAYHLLTQTQCPSWLYPVGMGGTTIWERWDSMLPDGSINPGDMTSFNHYALGAVADWMHRTVAGLGPAEPGYRTIRVAPHPGGGLTHAAAEHETPYGRAEVAWTRTGGELRVSVLVPPGTTAVVELPEPSWGTSRVGPGRHDFTCRFRPAERDPADPGLQPFRGTWSMPERQSTTAWQQVEIELTAEIDHADPYSTVDVWADFVSETGETLRRPAFWDGDRTWRIRFAPPAGSVRWAWATSASVADAGLAGQRGVVQVRAAEPTRDTFGQHGFWRMSPGGRSLVHADGTPALLIADTAWALPWRATPDQVTVYAEDRQAKGFNAVLLMTVQPDMRATGPAGPDRRRGFRRRVRGSARPGTSPGSFPGISRRSMRWSEILRAHGIAPVLQPVFFGFGWKGLDVAGPVVPPAEYARYCRYLVARYGAGPVIYLVGADGSGLEPQLPAGGAEIQRLGLLRAAHRPALPAARRQRRLPGRRLARLPVVPDRAHRRTRGGAGRRHVAQHPGQGRRQRRADL